MVSVSVCQMDRPGSRPARSVCFRKVGFYQHVINLSPPVPTTGSAKAAHVLCLCDNACKRSLAVVRVWHRVPLADLSVPIWPACAKNRDVNMIQTNKQTNKPANILKVSSDCTVVQDTPFYITECARMIVSGMW